MKAIPILIVTNVLALGLVLLLYLDQQGLKDQLVNSRRSASRAPSAELAGAERFEALEKRIADLTRLIDEPMGMVGEGDLVEGMRSADGLSTGESADGEYALPAIEDVGEDGILPSNPKMEVFRRQVRRANDLNSQEDRVRRMNESLDRLARDNRIGVLDDAQKEQVTAALLRSRARIPQILEKLRSDMTMRDLPREEQWEVRRGAFETLQAETQKELEGSVPAADAKVIVETMSRDYMRGGPGGGRGRGR